MKQNPDYKPYYADKDIGRPLSEIDYDPGDDMWE